MDPIQRLVGSVAPAATAGQPVISVDTKKMDLLGCYNNAGSDYRPRVRPRRVARRVGPHQIAPTLSAYLGVKPPSGSDDSALLVEVLRRH